VTNIFGSNASVIGPNGDVLTAADLPPQGATRWVPRRKAEIVAAVSGGLLSLTEACQRYRISHEEIDPFWVGSRSRGSREVPTFQPDGIR